MNIKEKDKQYIASTYARFDVHLTHGKGSIVFDDNGKEYIDMGSGIGVTAFGIADEQWVKATTTQLSTLSHVSNLYYTSPCVELAEVLCQRTGMKKVFFANSGAESNECAIKVARKYAQDKKGKEYSTVITLNKSFHGRTLTTLSATGQEVFHTLFTPLTPGFAYAEPNDFESVKSIVEKEKVCAIMIECVQGEGGVNALDIDFIKQIDAFCKEQDILFIVDEVQTGNGRCGQLYSYMNFGVNPDIVTTAKGLGGGLPIGACLIGEKAQDVLTPGTHGTTYGANPVCCAGALSVINRITPEFLQQVRQKSEYVFNELRGAKGITAVSGMGLMIGIKTEKDAKQVVLKCIEKGVIPLTAKDKVRLLPALNIPFETLKKAIEIIKEVCAE